MGLKHTLLWYKQALRLSHDGLLLPKYIQLNTHLASTNNCILCSGNPWSHIVLSQQYCENVCNLFLLVTVFYVLTKNRTSDFINTDCFQWHWNRVKPGSRGAWETAPLPEAVCVCPGTCGQWVARGSALNAASLISARAKSRARGQLFLTVPIFVVAVS